MLWHSTSRRLSSFFFGWVIAAVGVGVAAGVGYCCWVVAAVGYCCWLVLVGVGCWLLLLLFHCLVVADVVVAG